MIDKPKLNWEKQGFKGDLVDTHLAYTRTKVLFVLRTSESSLAGWKFLVHPPKLHNKGTDLVSYDTKELAQVAAELWDD